MCIDCLELDEVTANDDDWVPVKHRIHQFPLCVVRVPYKDNGQLAEIVFRIRYLIQARLPFIQPVYDFFVQETEVLVLAKRPQLTLNDLIVQSSALTDVQLISISYGMVLGIHQAHRHRMRAGRFTARDFLVFGNSYVCLSAKQLIQPACPLHAPHADIYYLSLALLGIYKDEIALPQCALCPECHAEEIADAQFETLVQHFTLQQQKTQIYKMMETLLRSKSWAECAKYWVSFPVSPMHDEMLPAYQARTCEKEQPVQQKYKAESTSIFSSVNPNLVDKIQRSLTNAKTGKAELLELKLQQNYSIDPAVTEAYIGVTQLVQFTSSALQEKTVGMPLKKYLQLNPYAERAPESKMAVMTRINEQRQQRQKVQTEFLVVQEQLTQDQARRVESALQQIVSNCLTDQVDQFVLLARIQLHSEGFVFVQNRTCEQPFNYQPAVSFIDFARLQFDAQVLKVNPDAVATRIEKWRPYIEAIRSDPAYFHAVALFAGQATLYMQYKIAQTLKVADFVSPQTTCKLWSERCLFQTLSQNNPMVELKDITFSDKRAAVGNTVPEEQQSAQAQVDDFNKMLAVKSVLQLDFAVTNIAEMQQRLQQTKRDINATVLTQLLKALITIIDYAVIQSCTPAVQARVAAPMSWLLNYKPYSLDEERDPQATVRMNFFWDVMLVAAALFEHDASQQGLGLLQNYMVPDSLVFLFNINAASFNIQNTLFRKTKDFEAALGHRLLRSSQTQDGQATDEALKALYSPLKFVCKCKEREAILCKSCSQQQTEASKKRLEALVQLKLGEGIAPAKEITQLIFDYKRAIKPLMDTNTFHGLALILTQIYPQSIPAWQQNYFCTTIEQHIFQILDRIMLKDCAINEIADAQIVMVTPQVVKEYIAFKKTSIWEIFQSAAGCIFGVERRKIPTEPVEKQGYLKKLLLQIKFVDTLFQTYLEQARANIAALRKNINDELSEKDAFEFIFFTDQNGIKQTTALTSEFVDLFSLLAGMSVDGLWCPSVLSLSLPPLLKPCVQLCNDFLALQDCVDEACSLIGRAKMLTDVDLISTSNILTAVQKLAAPKNFLQAGVDFETLRLLSRTAKRISLPQSLIFTLLNRECLRRLLLFENPEDVIVLYCRLFFGLRHNKMKSKQQFPQISQNQQTQLASSYVGSSRLSISVKAQTAFNSRASQNIQMGSLVMSKLAAPLMEAIELLGPRFLKVVLSVLAELSCDDWFWDGEAPDPVVLLQRWLALFYNDEAGQRLTGFIDVALIRDIICLLRNLNKPGCGAFVFDRFQAHVLAASLLRPDVPADELRFIVQGIFYNTPFAPEAVFEEYAPKLMDLYAANILRHQCIAIINTAFSQLSQDSDELQCASLERFYKYAFDGKKQTDAQLRDCLQLILSLAEHKITNGFVEQQLPHQLIDLLKQKPNEIKAQVIDIIFALRENQQITRLFQSLGMGNVLKRLVVKEQIKEKLTALLQLYK